MTAPAAPAPALVFLDTETTGLHPARRAWEIAMIRVEDGGRGRESVEVIVVDSTDLNLGDADPFGLKVGRFYERHPHYGGPAYPQPTPEYRAMRTVERLTRGAHLVGNVISFDADVLGQRMRAHGILPSWHYHTIDIEPMVIGYLRGIVAADPLPVGEAGELAGVVGLPWDSEALSAAIGVAPAGDDERHTALGDARWVQRMWAAMHAPAVERPRVVEVSAVP